MPTEANQHVVVVGCGVIGMTTALELRASGYTVEIWTRDDLAATTSAAAGAIWYPFLAEPRDAVVRWSGVTFDRLRVLAAEPSSGVRMCPVVEAFAEEEPDVWWADAVKGVTRLEAEHVPPGYCSAVRATVPVCDVPVHLKWLVSELVRAGVPVIRREIASFEEAFEATNRVVNCAGLGARALCHDDDLHPVRGQVCVLEGATVESAWIDDTTPRPRYVVPRPSSVIVGGTAQARDERRTPDPADTEEMMAAALAARPELSAGRVASVQVGMRPFRSAVRLERERLEDGRILVHNYGHGGSGYTVSWGCAAEVVSLLTA